VLVSVRLAAQCHCVPVAALFENLQDGASVQDFVLWFPGVSLEQARAVLDHAARSSAATA
jgi:uncharacterized protein (DUF433 family)